MSLICYIYYIYYLCCPLLVAAEKTMASLLHTAPCWSIQDLTASLLTPHIQSPVSAWQVIQTICWVNIISVPDVYLRVDKGSIFAFLYSIMLFVGLTFVGEHCASCSCLHAFFNFLLTFLTSLFHKTSQNPPHLCSKPWTDVEDIPSSAYLYKAERK